MLVENTCASRTLHVTIGDRREEVAPLGTTAFATEGGVVVMKISTSDRNAPEWSGFVPTDDKKPLLIGYTDRPYVTDSDSLFPNCLSSGVRWFWIMLLMMIAVVIASLLLLR